MSVAILYCEGHRKSIDIRVIRHLLPKCDIRPLGGKTTNFFNSIIADRRRNPNLACLVDHDFDCRNWSIVHEPLRCNYENIWIGWSWARKEIENYLIDPLIVQQALGKKAPALDEYQNVLDEAAEKISAYSAARTALSCENFKNFWGEEIKTGYLQGHCFPRKLGKKSCREKIAEIVRDYRQNRLVSEEDVQTKFDHLLPQFRQNGSRFENYLQYFAGKDLLYMMRERLRSFGFEPPANVVNTSSPEEVFIERILQRLERSDRVWEWLPEWKKLRQFIEETNF